MSCQKKRKKMQPSISSSFVGGSGSSGGSGKMLL